MKQINTIHVTMIDWKLTGCAVGLLGILASTGVRSAMHAASQLPAKGHTDVDDDPAPAH